MSDSEDLPVTKLVFRATKAEAEVKRLTALLKELNGRFGESQSRVVNLQKQVDNVQNTIDSLESSFAESLKIEENIRLTLIEENANLRKRLAEATVQTK